jgi:tRNA-binding EMAP/Myf-like protein
MRGIESKGMLLAAQDMKGPPDAEGKPTERVEVLDASGLPTGTRVSIEGGLPAEPPAEIKIDDFISVPMKVQDYKVGVAGHSLLLGTIPVRTSMIPEGDVH